MLGKSLKFSVMELHYESMKIKLFSLQGYF